MKHRVALAVGLTLVLMQSTRASLKQVGESEGVAVQQIIDVLDRQVKAWNRRDLEGFMEGYWRSESLSFYSGGTKTNGWQSTLDRYRKSYQGEGREMGVLEFLDLKVELLGPQAAFVRGRYQIKMSATQPSGLFTLIFRKFGDNWKIVHDHTGAA